MNGDPSEPNVSISYDGTSNAYRATFDPAAIAPSAAVVEAMARVSRTDPVQLDPLADALDPTALDRICDGRGRDGDRIVEFDYRNHRVRVESSGAITIRPAADD